MERLRVQCDVWRRSGADARAFAGKHEAIMQADQVQRFFTGAEGGYFCARWGRPIVPVIFGTDDATLSVFKGAIEAVVALANHRMAETDTELGANLMIFVIRDWAELSAVPKLERMIPDLATLCDRLQARGANQYRTFRFDETGAIKACFVFLRMDDHLADLPAEAVALAQAAEAMLTWGEGAFAETSPLARAGGQLILRPEVGDVIRAAYGPTLPAVARDPSHALRLAARI